MAYISPKVESARHLKTKTEVDLGVHHVHSAVYTGGRRAGSAALKRCMQKERAQPRPSCAAIFASHEVGHPHAARSKPPHPHDEGNLREYPGE
jgi:hypothetical protein